MPVYISDVHSLALDCAKGIVLTERFRWDLKRHTGIQQALGGGDERPHADHDACGRPFGDTSLRASNGGDGLHQGCIAMGAKMKTKSMPADNAFRQGPRP